ncbi:hypothetical protein T01_8257 [Trichinella spiralis]|uniref:Uncharacterized protein n=2 Tax=Trichinella spiralis TaxID=6334 RepID=A0A0V1ALD4_TRISP|nr:hypothetical protein T01_15764 [Trichinella spiralis]KRY25370.1 hypothetical protein T01_8257 [Trichinella spiralis]
MAGGMIFTLFQEILGTFQPRELFKNLGDFSTSGTFQKSWGLCNLGNFIKILGTFQPRELFRNLGDFPTSGTL